MKITYVHPNVMPASAANTINVARMCDALAADHDVTLICRRAPGASADALFSAYGLGNRFKILFLPRGQWFPEREFHALSLAAHRLSGGDLVYTRRILCASMATAMGMDAVLEFHAAVSTLGSTTIKRFKRLLTRSTLRKVLTNSPATLADMRDVAGDHPRLVLAPHGASPARVVDTSGAQSRFTACYIGTFSAGRGIELLIAVAAMTPEVDFLLVGATQGQKERFDRLAADSGAANVDIILQARPSDIPPFLGRAHVLLAPYQREVFHTVASGGHDSASFMSPMKLFDYMPTGKPIVASRLPAIAVFIGDNVSGLLCDPDDPAEWRGALLRLRREPATAQRLGHAAQAEAREKYSWQARAKMAVS